MSAESARMHIKPEKIRHKVVESVRDDVAAQDHCNLRLPATQSDFP